MGVAVSIVMALATLVTYALYEYLMVPLGIAFLEIIVTEMVIGDMSSVMGEAAMNLGWAVLYAFLAGIGFTLVMLIMSGLREKLNRYRVGKALSGFPISMVTASFICMAFTVFSYIA